MRLSAVQFQNLSVFQIAFQMVSYIYRTYTCRSAGI